ncbi:MAG: hypothetical protein MRECE_6c021 [Mycoplasmataceae bacterium CE_OT135]|nr:MAG: hypothetical protein MRECE_6c021 [Mycoplasmataceae bacterium CE_OT135]
MENDKQKKELLKQLVEETKQKSRGFKWFIFGIILLIVNFSLMVLYNFIWYTVKFNNTNSMGTSWFGGDNHPVRYPWAQNTAKVLEFISKKTPFELIIFSLIWLTSLIIIVYGAYQWTHGQSKLKKIEAELKNLNE